MNWIDNNFNSYRRTPHSRLSFFEDIHRFFGSVHNYTNESFLDVRTKLESMSVESDLVEATLFPSPMAKRRKPHLFPGRNANKRVGMCSRISDRRQLREYLHAADAVLRRSSAPRGGFRLPS